jgi:hypothetical protein
MSILGILIRIDEMAKTYQCYIFALWKVIISRDVVVDENAHHKPKEKVYKKNPRKDMNHL